MNRYKPYPAYKNSGVEWLGEVPAHWELTKLKHLASFSGGGTPSRDNPAFWNGKIPWVSPKDMKAELIEVAEEFITDEGLLGSSTSLVPPGRVLMVVRSGILKHTIPVAINNVAVALNQDMKALAFKKQATHKFFLRWVQGLNDELLLTWSKQGATVESIEHAYLAETIVPLPSDTELVAIATFLDRETTKLDTLIAKQEKLIELLQEKRQALIFHAVTKGLNPDVPMKDSGVEWLGKVPEHWEVKRLRFVGEAIIGLTYDPTDVVDEPDGVLVLRSSNVQGQRITFDDNVYVSAAIPEKLITRVGDILICSRNGSRALIGKNAKIESNSAGVTFGAFMTIFRSNSNAFLFFVFNSMIFDYQAGSFMTSTVNQLTVGNLYSFEVPMPPMKEQISIVAFLDHETTKLDTLIEKSRRSIDLMREHRTALISAAVTGKIDVRGAT